MRMLSRNKIKNPKEQKLGEGGDDKQIIKLMWPNLKIPEMIQYSVLCKNSAITLH